MLSGEDRLNFFNFPIHYSEDSNIVIVFFFIIIGIAT